MKPLIGINLDIVTGPPSLARVQASYYEAIQLAGGVPILLPPLPDADLDQLLSLISGVLLIGGADYSPNIYGEAPHSTLDLVDSRREDFDLRLIERLLNWTDLPLLGICGGCQALNIALGGSLIQDIASELPCPSIVHTTSERWPAGMNKHMVALEPDSKLAQIYQVDRMEVPTFHHQAVKVAGRGLKVVARSDDGVIEAIESSDRRFIIGVQWHPERDLEHNQALFIKFVQESALVGAKNR